MKNMIVSVLYIYSHFLIVPEPISRVFLFLTPFPAWRVPEICWVPWDVLVPVFPWIGCALKLVQSVLDPAAPRLLGDVIHTSQERWAYRAGCRSLLGGTGGSLSPKAGTGGSRSVWVCTPRSQWGKVCTEVSWTVMTCRGHCPLLAEQFLWCLLQMKTPTI